MKINNEFKIRGVIVSALVIFFVSFLTYYLYEANEFVKGVKKDIVRRDSILNKNGIRLDSMGVVNYDDYKKIKDSLDAQKLK